MNADSAIMTGWVEPGGVMDRMGDGGFPEGVDLFELRRGEV
jgi:hypothetical protein